MFRGSLVGGLLSRPVPHGSAFCRSVWTRFLCAVALCGLGAAFAAGAGCSRRPNPGDEPSSASASRPESTAPAPRVVALPPFVDLDDCGPPADFELEHALDAVLQYVRAGTPVQARILAWSARADGRGPLAVQELLVWFQLRRSDFDLWWLVHLGRTPVGNAHTPWHVAMVFDAPWFVGAQSYFSAPTPADLDHFIRASMWLFGAVPQTPTTGAAVCRRAWRNAMGEEPTHTYR